MKPSRDKQNGEAGPRLRLLRLVLAFGAAGWLVSIVGAILPWDMAATGLRGLGAGALPRDPMLDYWLRMAAGGFSCVGILFALAALWPRKYAALIPVLGVLSVLEGLLLGFHGLRLGLPPLPFLADTLFCLGVGFGILLTRHSVLEPVTGCSPCKEERS